MAKKLKKTAKFGGKEYTRYVSSFKTKAEVQESAERLKTYHNNYVIIDKNKDGWFMWLRSKPKKPTVKRTSIKRMSIPEDFREKFNSIKKEYDMLDKTPKKELVEIAQRGSRLDISHIKSEDRYSIRNYILRDQFSRKSLEKFDKYNK